MTVQSAARFNRPTALRNAEQAMFAARWDLSALARKVKRRSFGLKTLFCDRVYLEWAPPASTRLASSQRPEDRWPDLIKAMRTSNPSSLWRKLVAREPCLAPFDLGGILTRDRLIERLTIIIEQAAVWGEDVENEGLRAYIIGVAYDARLLMLAAEDDRTSRASTWTYLLNDLCHCAVCWHLTPRGARTGFKDGQALCADHRPSLGARQRAARTRAKRVMKRILGPDRRPRVHIDPEHFIEAGLEEDTARFGDMLRAGFPLVAEEHPGVSDGLEDLLRSLSGLPGHVINDLLAECREEPQRAGILYLGMLKTRQLWLEDERRHPRRSKQKVQPIQTTATT